MNENAGPACALSVLIVVVFAVLLHDKIPPPTAPRPMASVTSETSGLAPGPPAASDSRLRLTGSDEPRISVPVATPKGLLPTVDIRTGVSSSGTPPRTRLVSKPERVASPRPIPPRSRSSTAIVATGETLVDVATRAYGSPEAWESIWKANRDQLPYRETPLTPGMLLRTP